MVNRNLHGVNMSRILADECEYMDAEWYGVDIQGIIAIRIGEDIDGYRN